MKNLREVDEYVNTKKILTLNQRLDDTLVYRWKKSEKDILGLKYKNNLYKNWYSNDLLVNDIDFTTFFNQCDKGARCICAKMFKNNIKLSVKTWIYARDVEPKLVGLPKEYWKYTLYEDPILARFGRRMRFRYSGFEHDLFLVKIRWYYIKPFRFKKWKGKVTMPKKLFYINDETLGIMCLRSSMNAWPVSFDNYLKKHGKKVKYLY